MSYEKYPFNHIGRIEQLTKEQDGLKKQNTRLGQALEVALNALDEEAMIADGCHRNVVNCSAWFKVRAEGKAALKGEGSSTIYASRVYSLRKELDELRARAAKCDECKVSCDEGWLSPDKAERLRSALSHIGGYAMTVRMDRKKVVDGDVMCLQMEDWCKGLLECVEEAKQVLEEAKE